MDKLYHIGFIKHKDTLIIQARTVKDTLDCELWQYHGEHLTTKRKLYAQRYAIRDIVNKENLTTFKSVRIE
jgi:hypothetical protein